MRRITKGLFPKRGLRPTLSSPRHAAAARWKMAYVTSALNEEQRLPGLAIVAAMLGHASDETATKHYARASTGDGVYPVPEPDPAEIARIRHCLKAMARGSPYPEAVMHGQRCAEACLAVGFRPGA